ncbi:MAG: hypothetical protein R2749_31450 [Acidimicrobiales bacterium]
MWLDVTVGVLLLVPMLGIVVPLLPGVALAWLRWPSGRWSVRWPDG